jgi:hypothetical protein
VETVFYAQIFYVQISKVLNVHFTPEFLDLEFNGHKKNVHYTLLQKSNSDYYLLVWQEISSYDKTHYKDIDNQDVEVSLCNFFEFLPGLYYKGYPLFILYSYPFCSFTIIYQRVKSCSIILGQIRSYKNKYSSKSDRLSSLPGSGSIIFKCI